MLANLRAADQRRELGEALLDQRLVAGIGNIWRAEALWRRAALAVAAARRDDGRGARAPSLGEARTADAARRSTGGRVDASRLPPRRPSVPALRRDDRWPRPGRRQPHRVLVSRLPERRGAGRGVRGHVAVRSPQLYEALRRFCLGAFAYLYRESQDDAPLPFSFEEHAAPGRPALYEYRPLARGLRRGARRPARGGSTTRSSRSRSSAASRRRRSSRTRTPAPDTTEESALFRTILLPFLVRHGRALRRLRVGRRRLQPRLRASSSATIFGESHAYGAVAPLVGLSCAAAGRARPQAARRAWPLPARSPTTGRRRTACCPPGFGREPERTCVIELECEFPAGAVEPPDAPGEIADAVTALRLATAAPDRGRPRPLRAARLAAVRHPAGAADRRHRAAGRADAARRVPRPARRRPARAARRRATRDAGLGEALDRWELSLFAAEPYRSEQLRESLAALLGGGDGLWAAAARLSVLVGDDAADRGELFARLRGLTSGGHASTTGRRHDPPRAGRGADGRRPARGSLERLDDSLLGLKPRPRSYFARAVDRQLARNSARSRHEAARLSPATVGTMDEARAVLARLERIEALERGRRAGRVLLDEVRGLLARSRGVGARRAAPGPTSRESALERCREALRQAETPRRHAQDSGNVARKRPHDGPLAGSTSA